MTKSSDRPSSPRGERRRAQIIEGALALLEEGGWEAITTRAVAERSDANVGLIHYHFGGLPGLRVEVAHRAVDKVVGPIVELLVEAPDERAALESLRSALPGTLEDRSAITLTIEVLAGALRHPELGVDLRAQNRLARERIAERLTVLRPDWSRQRCFGVAMVAMALIDGLALHLVIDDEAPGQAALDALDDLLKEGR